MLEFRFVSSKTGSETLQVKNRFWHSAYDPRKEALLWASQLNIEKSCVLLIGDGINYATAAIKERFPQKTIFTVAVSGKSNSQTYWSQEANQTLEQFFSTFVNALTAKHFQVVIWPTALNIAPEWVRDCLSLWEQLIKEQQANLATYQGMGRRWLANALRRASYNPEIYFFTPSSYPVLVLASGTSLNKSVSDLSLPTFLKVALTSSLTPLAARGLVPDITAATDGGYWAGLLESTRPLPRISPISSILPSNPGPWFAFSQGYVYEQLIFGNELIPNIPAKGTVTYSIIKYLSLFFNGPIGIAGLDLGEIKGQPHLKPHPIDDWFLDHRLNPPDTRLTKHDLLRSTQKVRDNFYQSATARMYQRGLLSLQHPNLFRIHASPVELENMKNITIKDWIKLCEQFKDSKWNFYNKSFKLWEGAQRWYQIVQEAYRSQNLEHPALQEVFLHLQPEELMEYRQSRVENKGTEEAKLQLLQKFEQSWNNLWLKWNR